MFCPLKLKLRVSEKSQFKTFQGEYLIFIFIASLICVIKRLLISVDPLMIHFLV